MEEGDGVEVVLVSVVADEVRVVVVVDGVVGHVVVPVAGDCLELATGCRDAVREAVQVAVRCVRMRPVPAVPN